MMFKKQSKVIRHDDLVEDGAISNYIGKELEDLVGYLPSVEAAIKKLAKSSNESLKGISLESVSVADLTKINAETEKSAKIAALNAKAKKAEADAQIASAKARQADIKTQKEQITLTDKKQKQKEKSKKLTDQEIAARELNKQKQKDNITYLKAEILEMDNSIKSINNLNVANAKLRALVRNADLATKEGRESAKKWNEEIDKNTAVINANSDKLVQSKMNIGNYKDAIKEAASELGFMDGILGRTFVTLTSFASKIKENVLVTKEAEAATNGWGKAMLKAKGLGKGFGLALLGAGIAAIGAYFKTTKEGFIQFETIIESAGSIIRVFIGKLGQFGKGLIDFFPAIFKDISNGFTNLKNDLVDFFTGSKSVKLATDNTSKSIDQMAHAFDGLGEATKKAIKLSEELVKLRLKNREDNLKDVAIIRVYASEVEKLNQIASDQTRSFADRDKATQEALELQKKSADAEVRIKERAVKEDELALKKAELNGEITIEQREKLAESLNALDDAQTKRDIEKYNIEQQNRLNQIKQLQNQIQLIEQTFDKEKELRDKEIADLEKSYAERRRISEEGDSLSDEKYKKEIQRISEATKTTIDANALLNESDEDQLAQRIKNLNLGDKAEDALLKALSNRKAEIKSYYFQLTDLEKQRTEDLKKQQEIENNIRKERIRTNEILIDRELKQIEGNVQRQRELIIDRYNLQVKELEQQADFEKKQVDADKTTSPEAKAKKKTEIEAKLYNDLLLLQNGYIDSKDALDKKEVEKYKAHLTTIENALANGLQKRAELQQAYDQKAIDYQKRTLDIQSKLAAEGKDNVLAETESRLQQAEEKRIQDQKRAAKAQENITIAKTFTEVLTKALESKKPFIQALGEAGAATGVVEAVLTKLFAGSFKVGTEDTGTINGGGVDGQGGRIAILHDNERVLTKEQNNMIGNLSNDELARIAFAHQYKPVFDSANVTTTTNTTNVDTRFVGVLQNELRELKQVIKDKPTQTVELGRFGEWQETITKGMSQTIRHYRNNSSRPSIRFKG